MLISSLHSSEVRTLSYLHSPTTSVLHGYLRLLLLGVSSAGRLYLHSPAHGVSCKGFGVLLKMVKALLFSSVIEDETR